MAELRAAPRCAAGQSRRFKEAVCIETERIFDSCGDKDCLGDLYVFFSERGQSVIDQSSIIKCKSAELIYTYLSVEPVPFNKGYYTVDITFYFRENFSCYMTPASTPVNVRGLSHHSKKLILFGGEHGVKTFYSNYTAPQTDTMPVACIKAADPIVLSSRVADDSVSFRDAFIPMPEPVTTAFEDEIVAQQDGAEKTILVTLGIFTIVTLQRSAQIMVPMYDYVLPEKECAVPVADDEPCEMFKRIRFPVNEFFPDNVNGAGCEKRCGQ